MLFNSFSSYVVFMHIMDTVSLLEKKFFIIAPIFMKLHMYM